VADLVLEGGGVRGIAHLGALTALRDAGIRPHRIAGCSAGAIMGSFSAAGLDLDELRCSYMAVDCRSFLDPTRLRRLPISIRRLSVDKPSPLTNR
jgi:NTE family protein